LRDRRLRRPVWRAAGTAETAEAAKPDPETAFLGPRTRVTDALPAGEGDEDGENGEENRVFGALRRAETVADADFLNGSGANLANSALLAGPV